MKMIFVLLFISAFFFCPAQSDSVDLKIMSWNIKFLPGWINPSHKNQRAKDMAEIFNHGNYDVIVLQEAFKNHPRKLLAKSAKEMYPYSWMDKKKTNMFKITNSGLMVLSKYPITPLKLIRFHFNRRVEHFASKSALLFEIEKDGEKFLIVNTHLQSDYGKQDFIVTREMQMKEMFKPFFWDYSLSEKPHLMAGDFNIDRSNQKEFDKIGYVLPVIETPLSSDLKITFPRSESKELQEQNKSGSQIDYIFHTKYIGKIIEMKVSSNSALSDHYPIEAIYRKPVTKKE